MQLSEHFSLDEFIRSETALEHGINNQPDESMIEILKCTASGLELIRMVLGGRPVHVSSGYRCKELNALVGGAPDSQHVKGEAVDFECPEFGTPREIALFLKDKLSILGIDQLIMEGTWVHASFSAQPRAQLLSLKNGKYVLGVV